MINWSKVVEWLLAPTAGLFGGISALRYHQDVRTAWEISLFLFTSICCATFLTGLIAQFQVLSQSAAGGVGYLLGVFGGSCISALLRWVQSVDITDLITRLKWW